MNPIKKAALVSIASSELNFEMHRYTKLWEGLPVGTKNLPRCCIGERIEIFPLFFGTIAEVVVKGEEGKGVIKRFFLGPRSRIMREYREWKRQYKRDQEAERIAAIQRDIVAVAEQATQVRQIEADNTSVLPDPDQRVPGRHTFPVLDVLREDYRRRIDRARSKDDNGVRIGRYALLALIEDSDAYNAGMASQEAVATLKRASDLVLYAYQDYEHPDGGDPRPLAYAIQQLSQAVDAFNENVKEAQEQMVEPTDASRADLVRQRALDD
jgi:hypothetical protein